MHLSIKWSLSRGQDTYGWNLVSLLDTETGKRYRAKGGGYDMLGTVLGKWLENRYQKELLAVSNCAAATYDTNTGMTYSEKSSWYHYGKLPLSACKMDGMTYEVNKRRVDLNGSAGLDAMKEVAHAIRLRIKSISNPRGRTVGFEVEPIDAST